VDTQVPKTIHCKKKHFITSSTRKDIYVYLMWNTVEKKGHALKIKIAHPSSKNWLSIHNTKGAAIWFRVIQPTIQSFMNTYKQNAQYNRAQGQGPTEGQPMHSK